MLLRSQDAGTEQCPLDPEEYQEGLGEATLVVVPLDPVRDESGQRRVEWTMWRLGHAFHGLSETCMNVNSASSSQFGIGLPVRVQLVPEVYLSWKEEEEKHTEHRGHEQALDTQCQLHPPPCRPWGLGPVLRGRTGRGRRRE